MSAPKRKKDSQTYTLTETTENLLAILEDYRYELEAYLSEYSSTQRATSERTIALQNHIAKAKSLEELVDQEGWDLVRAIANGSAYVEHARTGDYF